MGTPLSAAMATSSANDASHVPERPDRWLSTRSRIDATVRCRGFLGTMEVKFLARQPFQTSLVLSKGTMCLSMNHLMSRG
jgi:hypothetical protein